MAKFHSLPISDVRKETQDCVSVAFAVPAALAGDFRFIQGQYLTLKLQVGGEEIRRSYSICSGTEEGELRVAVKRVKMGKGSNHIFDTFKTGDSVEIMPPMGSFHSPMSAANKKAYYLFAGGSGITPMFSIIKTVLVKEPHSTLHLFYGNLNEESTIFRQQLSDLAAAHPTRLHVVHVLEKPSAKHPDELTGLLTQQMIEQLVNTCVSASSDNEFFICGPTPMMDNARLALESKGVDSKRIHIEYFTAQTTASETSVAEVDVITSEVTVIQYGMETTFALASNGISILDAAIDQGVDAPYACKGAVCATCRGRVVEGKVKMLKNFALTEQEVADGFILTCQSHPASEVVKVDYDA